jgi:hypothetical protein
LCHNQTTLHAKRHESDDNNKHPSSDEALASHCELTERAQETCDQTDSTRNKPDENQTSRPHNLLAQSFIPALQEQLCQNTANERKSQKQESDYRHTIMQHRE